MQIRHCSPLPWHPLETIRKAPRRHADPGDNVDKGTSFIHGVNLNPYAVVIKINNHFRGKEKKRKTTS